MRGHRLSVSTIACIGGAMSAVSSSCGTDFVDKRPLPWHASLWPMSWFPHFACRADSNGCEAINLAQAPDPSPISEPSSPGTRRNEPDDDTDTITGVFHRLDPQHARLVLVQVVFRHGARTPLSRRSEMWRGQRWDVCGEAYQAAAVRLFSTAGVENPGASRHDLRQRSVILDGGCSMGELTLLGQSQALNFGRWLRDRYVNGLGFLPPTHEEGLVEARTTNISRTIATLRGLLTGLYPDLPRQHATAAGGGAEHLRNEQSPAAPPHHHYHHHLHHHHQQQEVAARMPRVTTSGDLDEILYADTRACPHLGSLQSVSRESGRAVVHSDPDYEWARGQLLQLLNLDPVTFDTDRWIFTDIHDVLTSLSAHGKALPPGFVDQPKLLAVINRLATKEFGAEVAPSVRDAHGRTVLRLAMGRLLHILVENMQRTVTVATATAAADAVAPGDGAVTGTSEPTASDARSPAHHMAATAPTPIPTTTAGPRGQPLPKMYLYSGHDSTIMPLLSALGLEVEEWPPYLSNLILELWELPSSKSGGTPRYVVRVLYNKDELSLPHCPAGFLPSLQTFQREVVGPFLLSAQRYQELCRVKIEHEGAMPRPKAKATSALP